MALPYIDKYPLSDKAEFEKAVIDYSQKLAIRPEWLMAVMHFETAGKMDPGIVNNIGATGLIQFMPSTAIGLGTTTEALRTMTGTEQMAYVYKYLEPHKNKIRSLTDLYLAVFYPYAIKRTQDYVLGSQAGPDSVAKIAKQNPSFGTGKGYISKQDVTNFISSRYPEISKIVLDTFTDVKKKIVETATTTATFTAEMVKANPLAFGLFATGVATVVLYFGFLTNRRR